MCIALAIPTVGHPFHPSREDAATIASHEKIALYVDAAARIQALAKAPPPDQHTLCAVSRAFRLAQFRLVAAGEAHSSSEGCYRCQCSRGPHRICVEESQKPQGRLIAWCAQPPGVVPDDIDLDTASYLIAAQRRLEHLQVTAEVADDQCVCGCCRARQ